MNLSANIDPVLDNSILQSVDSVTTSLSDVDDAEAGELLASLEQTLDELTEVIEANSTDSISEEPQEVITENAQDQTMNLESVLEELKQMVEEILATLVARGAEGRFAAGNLLQKLSAPDSQEVLGNLQGTNVQNNQPSLPNVQQGERTIAPSATGLGRGEDINAGPGTVVPAGGDLQAAIDSAKNGDVIKLEAGTYDISDLTINKQITIDGTDGTVLDGGGSETGINILSGGSGSVIQDVEMMNFQDRAISGTGAKNLLLQNLDIHHVGIGSPLQGDNRNTAIHLDGADGFQILNSNITDVDRKGIGIGVTNGGVISGVSIAGINEGNNHDRTWDVGAIKSFQASNIDVIGNAADAINGNALWFDHSDGVYAQDNIITNVGLGDIGLNGAQIDNTRGLYFETSTNSGASNNTITGENGFEMITVTNQSAGSFSLGDNFAESINLTGTDWVGGKIGA